MRILVYLTGHKDKECSQPSDRLKSRIRKPGTLHSLSFLLLSVHLHLLPAKISLFLKAEDGIWLLLLSLE